MNEWINKQMNEWMNKRINEWNKEFREDSSLVIRRRFKYIITEENDFRITFFKDRANLTDVMEGNGNCNICVNKLAP